MYFPLLKPHGQGKRSAAQPKAIDSALPLAVGDSRFLRTQPGGLWAEEIPRLQ